MSKKMLLVLLTGVLLLSACSGSSTPWRDDFSNPDSGWQSGASVDYVRGYQQGKYYLRVDTDNWLVWTSAGKTYKDVLMRITAFSEEARDNTYGLICRASKERFYYFAISADGFYNIYRHEADGSLIPLAGSAMQRHPAIHTDGRANLLEARCIGSQLTLIVNGQTITTVEDSTLRRGQVGLAGSKGRDDRPAIIWFDDLEVERP